MHSIFGINRHAFIFKENTKTLLIPTSQLVKIDFTTSDWNH